MKTRRHSDPPVSDRTFKAAGLFARLADAMDQGDLAAAAAAQADLARLGFNVRIGSEPKRPEPDRSHLKPFPSRHEADGRRAE